MVASIGRSGHRGASQEIGGLHVRFAPSDQRPLRSDRRSVASAATPDGRSGCLGSVSDRPKQVACRPRCERRQGARGGSSGYRRTALRPRTLDARPAKVANTTGWRTAGRLGEQSTRQAGSPRLEVVVRRSGRATRSGGRNRGQPASLGVMLHTPPTGTAIDNDERRFPKNAAPSTRLVRRTTIESPGRGAVRSELVNESTARPIRGLARSLTHRLSI